MSRRANADGAVGNSPFRARAKAFASTCCARPSRYSLLIPQGGSFSCCSANGAQTYDLQAVAIEFSPNGPPIDPQVLETPKICLPFPFLSKGKYEDVTFMTPKRFVWRWSRTSSGTLRAGEVRCRSENR